MHKLYGENFKNIVSLSNPAKVKKNTAYNNYDINFISDKELKPTPGGGGTGGGGSEDIKTTAVLANGKEFTDVLTATVLANELDCPILLTETNSISRETMDELNRRNWSGSNIWWRKVSVSKCSV